MPTPEGIFFNQSQWCIEWTGFDCSQITEIVFFNAAFGPFNTHSPILAWLSAEVPSCHSVYLRQDGYLAHTNRTEGTSDDSCECCDGALWIFTQYSNNSPFFLFSGRLYVWQSGEAFLRWHLRGAREGWRWVFPMNPVKASPWNLLRVPCAVMLKHHALTCPAGDIKQESGLYREGPSYQRRGSLQLWQFLVALLDDPSNSHFIAWTGRGMEFKLIEPEEVRGRQSFRFIKRFSFTFLISRSFFFSTASRTHCISCHNSLMNVSKSLNSSLCCLNY